jgi:hypothetical protein
MNLILEFKEAAINKEAVLIKDYLEDKIKENIIKEISSLDLPKEWTPKQVIDYIVYKIDRN